VSSAIRVNHASFGRLAILEMGSDLVMHAHGQAHLLARIGGSDASFLIDGVEHAADENTLLCVNSWEPHAYRQGGPKGRTTFLILYIECSYLAASCGRSPTDRFFAHPTAARAGAVGGLVDAITSHLVGSASYDDVYLEELVADLFSTLPGIRAAPGETWRHPSDFRIRRSIAHMRGHIGERINLDDLALRSGLSRPHFFDLFKQQTGLTPNQYWDAVRMDCAVRQLGETCASIHDIASNIGFTEQTNFTRFFRFHLGVTPNDYRRVARSSRTIAA
jgi:AraC-like DNA-binding protein